MRHTESTPPAVTSLSIYYALRLSWQCKLLKKIVKKEHKEMTLLNGLRSIVSAVRSAARAASRNAITDKIHREYIQFTCCLSLLQCAGHHIANVHYRPHFGQML
jgi:methionine aminopeptidase